jgi:hypothetical protein
VKPSLKRIDTNTDISFESFTPQDSNCFGVWLNASIGSSEGDDADDFQIFVCNHAWLARQRGTGEQRYILLDRPYQAGAVVKVLEAYLAGCSGDNWSDVAAQVSKIGVWEFEGYRP